MKDSRSFARRLILAAGLAAAVLGTAALGGPAAGADPPPLRPIVATVAPSLGPLGVSVKGTEATVIVTSSVPTAVTYEVKRVGATPPPSHPPRGPLGGVANPLGTVGVATTGDTPPPSAYRDKHEIALKGLTSNTAYDVFVAATTQAGERLTAQTRVSTAKKRVRITLESIDIKDDGDGFLSGDGEPLWFVKPSWDGVVYQPAANGGALCYPNFHGRCEYGSFGEDRVTPRNAKAAPLAIVFAEENFDRFPTTLALDVWAEEDDAVGGAWVIECVTGGCPVGEDTVRFDWRVPQGVESVSQRITLRGDDGSTGFESVLTFRVDLFHDNASYPWHSRNMPSHTWYDF